LKGLTDGARTAPRWSAATPKRCQRVARLAFLAIIPLLALATASPPPAGAYAVATVIPIEGLYLRAAPGTQYPALELVAGGTRVAVTGPANAADWYPVVHKTMRGWMRGDFLDFPGDASTTTRRASVRAVEGAVLHAEPYAAAPRHAMIPLSATITVSVRTTSDGWVLAAHAGATGWISAEALQIEGQASMGPAAPPSAGAGPSSASAAGRSASLPGATGPVRSTITYYHPSLEGGVMACGGRYRAEDPTIAAATSWPCGTRLRVCRNANCVVVTVQDTGEMGPNWVDLSASAFRQLAPLPEALLTGTVEVLPPGP
jgi:uncharacterized protein YraI